MAIRDRDRECGTKLNPAIGFIFLHGTDAQTIGDTPTALTWSKTTLNSTGLYSVDGKSKIYVKRGGAGLYMIFAQCGIERGQGAGVEATAQIYINGSARDCSKYHGMMGAKEHSDITIIAPMYLELDDYVEIYAYVDAGTGVIETDTARLVMMQVSMFGWDNSSGGKKMFRGGVMR